MIESRRKSTSLWFLGGLLLLMVASGNPEVRAEPPPWAPAHGYRAKHHRYYYYPSSQLYFDAERHHYFYYRGGQWQISARLPGGISLHAGDAVALDLATDRPYLYHPEVVKKYPPGLLKKQRGKWKGKKRF